jgi:aquaporin related protein
MNPIRSLAPCIVNRSFPDYLWIYFVGPIAGVILAVLVYKLVKALEYETAQDQDQRPELILPMARNVDERKPSSVIPMASLNSGPPSVEHSPAKTPELRVQQPSRSQTKSISFVDVPAPEKEQKAVLPECYAD